MIKSNGGIIGPDNVTTGGAFGTASGVFKLGEVTNLIKESKWPTAGPQGHQVANSCRFNAASSEYLKRTSGTPTNAQKGTLSFWIKRSALGSVRLFANNVTSLLFGYVDFTSGDKLRCAMNDAGTVGIQTNRLFRDVSAWYHIVIACDTTQNTEADRVKLYVNGVQETSLQTNTQPSQNSTLSLFNASSSNGQVVGAYYNGSSYSSYFDGYIAEAVLIDGQGLAPTSFGEFNSQTGIWVPKVVTGLTFGTNGFYQNYSNSGALGEDFSGEDNDFTVNNLTSLDQSTDTCSTNFATLNRLTKASDVTLSNGNLTTLGTSNGINGTVGSATIGIPSSGKWYYEIQYVNVIADAYYPKSGLISVEDTQFGRLLNGDAGTAGYTTNSIGFRQNGQKFYNNSASSFGNSVSNGNIVQWYVDMDNGAVYVGINDTVQNSGNPASGASKTGAIWTFTAGTYSALMPSTSDYNGSSMSFNFGSPPYAISSGNTDGNGFGNFEYAVPTGYLSLNTKNLAAVLA